MKQINENNYGPEAEYRKSVKAFETLSSQEATESSISFLENIIQDSGFGSDATKQIHWATEILELIRQQNPKYAKSIDKSITDLHSLHKEVRKVSQKYVSDMHDIFSDVMLDVRHINRTSEEFIDEPVEGPMNESIQKIKSEFKRFI
jgi:hypothetical protein